MTKWNCAAPSILRGKSPLESEAAIRAELEVPTARVAAIGTSRRKPGAFRHHQQRRTSRRPRRRRRGDGIEESEGHRAVRRSGYRRRRCRDGVDRIAESLRERSLSSVTDKYRRIGTVANLAVFNRLGTLPTRNFQQSTFDDADALSGETLTENNFSRRHGCAACTIRCERLFKALNGEEQRLEYETLFALGPLCGIDNPDVVLEAARLCDLYGSGYDQHRRHARVGDGMQRKRIAAGSEALRFGRADELLAIIPAIAERRGLGALLAEGSRRARSMSACGSDYWAMHVKGLELPGYEPRSLKSMALGPRGEPARRLPQSFRRLRSGLSPAPSIVSKADPRAGRSGRARRKISPRCSIR